MGLKVKKIIGTMNNSNPPSIGKLEQKCPPQLVLGLLLGKGSSAIGLFVFPVPSKQPQRSLQKLTWPSFPLDSEVTNNANHVRRLKL